MKPTKDIEKAYNIAVTSLRSCYGNSGIYAGLTHFKDYWARDSFFSCLGALEIGDKDIVKKNLELFLKFTRSDGQVPLRIGNYSQVKKYLRSFFGRKQKVEFKPRYINDSGKDFPIDVNALILVASYYYIKETKDFDFAKRHYSKFQKILKRNFENDRSYNLMLENRPHSSWDDSLKIKGESIYSNVCHAASIRSIYEISKLLKKKDTQNYLDVYEKVRAKINDRLWNGKYYSNYYWNGDRVDIFSTAGNLLSIHWKVADEKQANLIENEIDSRIINKYVPSLTNDPKYPYKMIFYPFYLIGMHDYHNNGMCWLWLGCEDAIAKFKLGRKKQSYELFKRIAKVINDYGGVYEVYEKSGKPVSRLFYKSEVPFAWSSSLFIKAYHTLFSKGRVSVM